MKHGIIRMAAAAASLGLAAGVTLTGAGSAQAVASNWLCDTLSPPSGGTVFGGHCQGLGGGTGWFQVYIGGGAYMIVYRCTNFVSTLVNDPPTPQYYNVTGTGCIPAS